MDGLGREGHKGGWGSYRYRQSRGLWRGHVWAKSRVIKKKKSQAPRFQSTVLHTRLIPPAFSPCHLFSFSVLWYFTRGIICFLWPLSTPFTVNHPNLSKPHSIFLYLVPIQQTKRHQIKLKNLRSFLEGEKDKFIGEDNESSCLIFPCHIDELKIKTTTWQGRCGDCPIYHIVSTLDTFSSLPYSLIFSNMKCWFLVLYVHHRINERHHEEEKNSNHPHKFPVTQK